MAVKVIIVVCVIMFCLLVSCIYIMLNLSDCGSAIKKIRYENMNIAFTPIYCLIGSSSLKNEMLEVAKKLELEGKVVLLTHTFSHADGYDHEITSDEVTNLHQNSKCRMSIADTIVLVTKGNYIGDSALQELIYAKNLGKCCKVCHVDDIFSKESNILLEDIYYE